ncbi:hypothetical protein AOLI_G00223020 [Acnodon oligacanthus]
MFPRVAAHGNFHNSRYSETEDCENGCPPRPDAQTGILRDERSRLFHETSQDCNLRSPADARAASRYLPRAGQFNGMKRAERDLGAPSDRRAHHYAEVLSGRLK